MDIREKISNFEKHCIKETGSAERVLKEMLLYFDERTLDILLYKVETRKFSADAVIRRFNSFLYHTRTNPHLVFTETPPFLNPNVVESTITLALEVKAHYKSWKYHIDTLYLHPLSIDMCGNSIVQLVETYSFLQDEKYENMKNKSVLETRKLINKFAI